MLFHEKLRELKGEMSEAALASASGLPYATVHNYILGRRTPSFEAVVKLAKALGVDCRVFEDCVSLGGSSIPPPKPRGRPRKAEPKPARKPRKGAK